MAFKAWLESRQYAEQHNGETLEISITSYKENGVPVSTVMKHRVGRNWKYDSDMDSGEQGGAKELPELLRKLLSEWGLPS